MSFTGRFGNEPERLAERAGFAEGDLQDLAQDSVLEQALKNFRSSVHAWSEAEYSRARTAAKIVRHRSWRLAAGWALGCVLVAGGVSGAVYERHQRQELTRVAAARAAEHDRLVAEQRAQAQAGAEEEDLLAAVDSDISREVPSAMEPLAQLMTEDEVK